MFSLQGIEEESDNVHSWPHSHLLFEQQGSPPSLLHVILMQISRQCRVDLVLEIDKDELWLFFGYSTTVVLLVNYGLSVSQTFPFLLCSSLRCKKQRRHPPYPISWSYTQRYEKWRKERLWGFVSIKMQKALFHFQFHYFLDQKQMHKSLHFFKFFSLLCCCRVVCTRIPRRGKCSYIEKKQIAEETEMVSNCSIIWVREQPKARISEYLTCALKILPAARYQKSTEEKLREKNPFQYYGQKYSRQSHKKYFGEKLRSFLRLCPFSFFLGWPFTSLFNKRRHQAKIDLWKCAPQFLLYGVLWSYFSRVIYCFPPADKEKRVKSREELYYLKIPDRRKVTDKTSILLLFPNTNTNLSKVPVFFLSFL